MSSIFSDELGVELAVSPASSLAHEVMRIPTVAPVASDTFNSSSIVLIVATFVSSAFIEAFCMESKQIHQQLTLLNLSYVEKM